MRKNISLYDSLGYIIFMVIANLVGTITTLLLMSILGKSNDRQLIVNNYLLFSFLFALIGIAITTTIIALYFKHKLQNISLVKSESNWKEILKNFCLLTFPGELLRLILSVLPMKPGNMFGYRLFDGFISFPPNLVYDWLYITPNNRLEEIRKSGYTVSDNIIFIVVYLIYFAVIMSTFLFVFWLIWKKLDKVYKNEIKIHMD